MERSSKADCWGPARDAETGKGSRQLLAVDGLFCGGCARGLEQRLRKLEGVLDAGVHYLTASAFVHWNPRLCSLREIEACIASAGYRMVERFHLPVVLARLSAATEVLTYRLAIGVFFAMWSMGAAFVLYFGSGVPRSAAWWLALASGACLVPVIVAGRAILAMGWRSLGLRSYTIDTLISGGVLGAILISGLQLMRGNSSVYFDAAAMLIVLRLTGQWIETRVRAGSIAALIELESAAPETAWPASGGPAVSISELGLGDRVRVPAGAQVTIDGRIVAGRSHLNTAFLTGESTPLPVGEGDLVEAGLVLVRGPLVIRAQAGGDDTRLSSLIDLVRQYRDQPTRTQSAIESFTAIWVPLVMIGSPAIGFLVAGATSEAILITLLLWVVSCPCSLLLAAPVPHAAALSAASASGLVARGGDVLEAAAGVELAMLDKTGTLTSGQPRMTGLFVSEEENEHRALQIAAGLEQRSNHPYARSIIALAEERSLSASNVTDLTDGDAGVGGRLRGQEVMLGRADWLLERGVEIPLDIDSALAGTRRAGHGASVLAIDGRAVAAFGFAHDDAREGVDELIAALRENNVTVEILSGDEQASVEAFGERLGIPSASCRGGVDPEGKAQWVSERSKARRTMMAGDGFNDAGALAAADVGVAVGSGEQVNLDAADVLIPGEDPRALARFIDLSKRTRRAVSTNIAISVGITMLLVCGVLLGWDIKLWSGLALHEASALIVILNGMWVTGTGPQRMTTIVDLSRDLRNDLVEALKVAIGGSDKDSSATA